jgi:hypothetical protein
MHGVTIATIILQFLFLCRRLYPDAGKYGVTIAIILLQILSFVDGYMPMRAGRKGVVSGAGNIHFTAFLPTAHQSACATALLSPPLYQNASAASPENSAAAPSKEKPYENMM